MPEKSEVAAKVKAVLAAEANIPVNRVVETGKLTEWPLTLDQTALAYIAITLTEYVKGFSPSASVKVKEVRTEDLTVNGLVDLVYPKTQKL